MKKRTTLLVAAVGMALVLASGVALAAAGDLDRSFGGDGVVRTDTGPNDDDGRAMVVRFDGRIVVAGDGASGFHLVGYRPDGSLDRTFGGDGKVTTSFAATINGKRGEGAADALVLQPDGKVVAAGFGAEGGGDFALARYNPDGSLDRTFGGDGKVTTDFGAGTWDEARALVLQPDGKLVAAGTSNLYSDDPASHSDLALARYNPDGTLDGTFAEGGKATTDIGPGDEEGYDLALQRDGRLVAAGVSAETAGSIYPGRFVLVRYDADGSLDETFAEGGKEITPVGTDAGALGVAVRPDGRIVAAGYSERPREGTDFALAGYLPDGSPDPSFSDDGRLTTDMAPDGAYANDLALQSDGKIVAVGELYGLPGGIGIARYRPGGALDKSFSGDGKVRTDVNDEEYASAVVPRRGKLLVAGASARCADFGRCYSRFTVLRYRGD